MLSGTDPARNTAIIGSKLNAFDLVMMQETLLTPDPDPVAPTRVYFEILKKHSTHKYSAPMPTQPLGSNPKRPSALLADGLGIFSNFRLGEVKRMGWTNCFGGADTSDHGAADCRAMKGFAIILGGDTNLHIEKNPENPQVVADATIWSTFLKSTAPPHYMMVRFFASRTTCHRTDPSARLQFWRLSA